MIAAQMDQMTPKKESSLFSRMARIAVLPVLIVMGGAWPAFGAVAEGEDPAADVTGRTIGNQPGDRTGPVPARGEASQLLAQKSLPLEPLTVDASFSALRASVWKEGEVERMLLDGWVAIDIGQYHFKAERASVWILHRRINPENGEATIANEMAIYLEEVSEANRASSITATGRNLLMSVLTLGRVSLKSDAFHDAPPTGYIGFLDRAEQRLVELLKRPDTAEPLVAVAAPEIQRLVTQRTQPILPFGEPEPSGPAGLPDLEGRPAEGGEVAVTARREYFPPPEATVQFHADDFVYQFAEDRDESYAILSGHLVVQYIEMRPRPGQRNVRQLTLTADRAVIFTDPVQQHEIARRQFSADLIRGIYLEGDVVATDNEFTLRGPRMFYDFRANRALVFDAVLHTYDRKARLPIYIRADEVRQLAMDQWQADNVRISTTEFFVPYLSLGASTVNIQRRQDPVTGEAHTVVDARRITVRAGDLPVFWWPRYRGRAEDIPLRRIGVGGNERNGFTVRTQWNLLGLAGLDPPPGTDANLLLDYYEERGPGGGVDFNYQLGDGGGRAFGYIIQDDGEDRLSSGAKKNLDDQTRGLFSWWHRQRLADDWTLIMEANFISDVNFLDAFFEQQAEQRREYQSRIYLKQQHDNWALEIFANVDLNGFIANEDLLQSQGYQVEKLPEIGYYSFANKLWGGRISYSSEYRVSRMRLTFPRHTLSEIGQGFGGFGLPASTDLSAAAFAAGFREDFVNRFHTRHEFSTTLQWGPFKLVPFLVGRYTVYDDDFTEFSAQAEDQRIYGAAGVRINAQFARVDDSVSSRLLDLHRIRHIIEPSVTLWHGESDADSRDFPIFDLEVEGASTGSAVKLALRNTWQTQRGGPGRWRSVDVLRVDTNIVMHASETQGDFAIPRFFDYRPELSRFGDHFFGDFAWLVSDSFAAAGHIIYDLNESAVARSSIGGRIDHTDNLFTFADLRYFDADDDALLGLGLGYQLTPIYRFQGSTSYDINNDETRNINIRLIRESLQGDIVLGVSHNQFREETTLFLGIRPKGAGGQTFGGFLSGPDQRR